MSGFKDLNEVFDSKLRLPVGGKTYVIDAVDAETGLFIQALTGIVVKAESGVDVDPEELGKLKLDDDQERNLYKRVLGPVYDELLTDGLDWEQISLIGTTTIIRAASGEEAAELYWNSGGRPKAPRKAPADRKRSAKKGRQGSPAGTTNRRTPASSGASSSPTGS